jgi:hypothetical protein
MKQPTQAQFDAKRAKVTTAWNKMMDLRFAIERRYGSFQLQWCKASERNAYERASVAYDKASDAFYTLLDNAPRDWRRGVPMHWVVMDLSYQDAFRAANETLSVEPPRAYGF